MRDSGGRGWLDQMIVEVFSNLNNNSRIPWSSCICRLEECVGQFLH